MNRPKAWRTLARKFVSPPNEVGESDGLGESVGVGEVISGGGLAGEGDVPGAAMVNRGDSP